MIASIKLELWYLNTPEMLALIEQEGQLRAQGVMLSLFACLRLSHNAVGHRRMLNKLAHDCQCSADWLWHVVTDYGLFEYGADETFYSPYLSKTLGIGRKRTPSHRRARYNAHYNEDNDYNEDNNHHQEEKADVRVSDDTHSAGEKNTPVGPSAYETVDQKGLRHGKGGELVPWWAPPQTDVYARWSVVEDKWVASSLYRQSLERQHRQKMMPDDFMMKTAWEKLSPSEHQRIEDHARRK